MGSFKRQDLLLCSSKTSYKVFRERTLCVFGRIFYEDEEQVGEDLISNGGLFLFFFSSDWDTFPSAGNWITVLHATFLETNQEHLTQS